MKQVYSQKLPNLFLALPALKNQSANSLYKIMGTQIIESAGKHKLCSQTTSLSQEMPGYLSTSTGVKKYD